MLPQYKSRVFECAVREDRPFIVNPKPSTSFRPITLLQSGWTLQSDNYAAITPVDLFAVTCADDYIERFEDLLRQHRNYFVVYAIRRVRAGAKIGAVAFPMPIPRDFIARVFEPVKR